MAEIFDITMKSMHINFRVDILTGSGDIDLQCHRRQIGSSQFRGSDNEYFKKFP